jgi:hypothetical protein
MKCIGNACEFVHVEWRPADRVYEICNRSDRTVQVTLRSWAEIFFVAIRPHDSATVSDRAFEYPFQASFLA